MAHLLRNEPEGISVNCLLQEVNSSDTCKVRITGKGILISTKFSLDVTGEARSKLFSGKRSKIPKGVSFIQNNGEERNFIDNMLQEHVG